MLLVQIYRHFGRNACIAGVAGAAFYSLDMETGMARAMLAVSAGLVLAHVLPTWFIGFAEFDIENERVNAAVYTNSGPIGFGGFIGSAVASWRQGVLTPEGFTWSLGVLAVIAAVVSMSVWGSRTASRKFRFDLFFKVPRADWMATAIITMKFLGYQDRADSFMVAVQTGVLGDAIGVVSAMQTLTSATTLRNIWCVALVELKKQAQGEQPPIALRSN